MHDEDILEALSKLMDLVQISLEDSREKSIIITKLEEADLWLYKYKLVRW